MTKILQSSSQEEKDLHINLCATISVNHSYLLPFLHHFIDHGSLQDKETIALAVGKLHFMYIQHKELPPLLVHLIRVVSDTAKEGLVGLLKAYLS